MAIWAGVRSGAARMRWSSFRMHGSVKKSSGKAAMRRSSPIEKGSSTSGTVVRRRLLGLPAAEALGRSIDLIIPEKLRGRHWDGYRRVMATGMSSYAVKMLAAPGRCLNGNCKFLEFSIVIIRGTDDGIVGVSAIIRDVTASRRRRETGRTPLSRLLGVLGRTKAYEHLLPVSSMISPLATTP